MAHDRMWKLRGDSDLERLVLLYWVIIHYMLFSEIPFGFEVKYCVWFVIHNSHIQLLGEEIMLLAGQIRRWSLVALPAYTDRDLQQREQDNMRQAVSTLVEWGGQLAEASGNSHFKFGASESFHGIFC